MSRNAILNPDGTLQRDLWVDREFAAMHIEREVERGTPTATGGERLRGLCRDGHCVLDIEFPDAMIRNTEDGLELLWAAKPVDVLPVLARRPCPRRRPGGAPGTYAQKLCRAFRSSLLPLFPESAIPSARRKHGHCANRTPDVLQRACGLRQSNAKLRFQPGIARMDCLSQAMTWAVNVTRTGDEPAIRCNKMNSTLVTSAPRETRGLARVIRGASEFQS